MEDNNAIILNVQLVDIRIDPQQRLRKHSNDYKKENKFYSLKKSLAQWGLLHPIVLNKDLKLIAGFLRYRAASELGWASILAHIIDIPEDDELDIEFEENFKRQNFTDYEFYIAVALKKRKYYKQHPEAQRGKYVRSANGNLNNTPDPISISARFALITPSQKLNSFVNDLSTDLGLSRRTLYYKIEIGEAILDGRFSSKTISVLKQGNITQDKLISILNKHKNETKKQKKNKKKSDTTQEKDDNFESKEQININHDSTLELKKDREISSEEAKTVINKAEIKQNIAIANPSQQRDGNFTSKEVSIAYNSSKIENNTERNYQLKNNANPAIKNTIKKELKKDTCYHCNKASVVAIECEQCGYMTPKVICGDDIVHGKSILRNPYLKKCTQAPIQESI